MTDAKKKPKRPDWSGRYHVLRNGHPIATVTLSRQWTSAGPKHTVTIDDGPSETFTDPGYAMNWALRRIVPGEPVLPWYDGCCPKGLRLRAEGRAPWEPQPADEEPPPRPQADTLQPEAALVDTRLALGQTRALAARFCGAGRPLTECNPEGSWAAR
jgi:hypothetical protein